MCSRMPSVLNNKKDMHNKPAVTIPSLHYKKYNVGRRASVSHKCYPRLIAAKLPFPQSFISESDLLYKIIIQSNLRTTVTLGKWQGDRCKYRVTVSLPADVLWGSFVMQGRLGDCYIQVNFAEDIR